MSISVHSFCINNPLNEYSYFYGTVFDNTNVYPAVTSLHEGFNTVYQLATFTSVPDIYNYDHSITYEKSQTSEWLNNIYTDNSRKNFGQKEMSLLFSKPGSTSTECMNQENKSKIWRPFSPPPASKENNVEENNMGKVNTRNCNRSTFFSIKPSNVKIGLSKTSVFKAVRKNTFTCTQCSSRYMSSRQLNSHMRVHTGSKPFRCEYPNCFKSFARNEELTRHKRIHSGFKPHMCTICKKRFGRKDHLSKHLKTHLQTSEKKVYQCPFSDCGHRYTRSDALTRHKSTAHAIKNTK